MYAVIKTGGKQQKVQAGDVIEVEKLVHDGETVTFQPLLVVDDDGKTHVGAEAAKATVTAKPLGEKKGDKVKIFKYRPKTGYSRRQGHRQMYTLVEIQEVVLGKRAPAKKSEEAAEPEMEAAQAPKSGKGGKAASAGTASENPQPEAAPSEK
jgi:large subunit ribosomal protein L21